MNLTSLSKGAWLDFSAAWRRKGGDRLELWLPRNWPAEDSELRWRRVTATASAPSVSCAKAKCRLSGGSINCSSSAYGSA